MNAEVRTNGARERDRVSFMVMRRLRTPQRHTLGPPWTCSDKKTDRDDGNSRMFAPLLSERNWKTFPVLVRPTQHRVEFRSYQHRSERTSH